MPIEARFGAQAPTLAFTYRDAKGATTTRQAIPLALVVLKDTTIGLRAFCQLRQARRTFGLDRILAIHQVDGIPHPSWNDLACAVAQPRLRLQAALSFVSHAQYLPPAPAHWKARAGVPVGLAWRGADGQARMDPQAVWGPEDTAESRHAELARIAALYRGAQALLTALPKATMVMVWNDRAGWCATPGRWRIL